MKRFYKALFIFLSPLLGDVAFSQTAPGIEWQNTIGGSNYDRLYSIQQTFDGGYVLGGFSESDISGDKIENSNFRDFWIVKIDSLGNIQWQNTIGGNVYDEVFSVRQTSDSGFILGGYSNSNISGDKIENSNGGYDYWIVKLDSSGNIQWQNTIGGNNDDWLYSIRQANDGGYILVGFSRSNISGDKTENSIGGTDYWIVKTDDSGNIQWQNTIGGNGNEVLYSGQQTSDDGYVFGGYSDSNISGDKTENSNGDYDFWIIKTDSVGNIQWQNTVGGNNTDILFSIQQSMDGGYIIGGLSESNISGDKTESNLGGNDYWILKTDSSGSIQWQNTIGGNDHDLLRSIYQTSDGGYVLGGDSKSNISGDKTENCNGGHDYWLIKTDSIGNIKWQNTIGGNSFDYLYTIQQNNSGGYILGGFSSSNIFGDKTENCLGFYDYWIVKLGPDTITGIIQHQNQTSNIQFSPNPLTTQSTLIFSNPAKEKFLFTLYDITGRLCPCVGSPLERGQGCVVTTSDKIILEKGSKPPGVYLFNLTNQKTGERMNGKIVIQ